MNLRVPHGFVSQIDLSGFLIENNWPSDLADQVADAMGCHHGERAGPTCLNDLEGDRKSLGDKAWNEVRKGICRLLLDIFQPKSAPTKDKLSGPDFMLLAGLTSFADWTNHGRPDLHSYPHDHYHTSNATGGTLERGKAVPFRWPDE